MIKNYNSRHFEQFNPLPTYVDITEQYELLAKTKTGYIAKLTVDKSVIVGDQLSHALFESCCH